MKVFETSIDGVKIFEPKIHGDERGYFVETFRQEIIQKHLGHMLFVQENESCSKRGVVRGLHYQVDPAAQAKLVRVVQGSVIDLILDIRSDSKTFGQLLKIDLDDRYKRQVFIPSGLAHGFAVISKRAIVGYKVDRYYSPKDERGVNLMHPALNLKNYLQQRGFNQSEIIISKRDTSLPKIELKFQGIENGY